MIFERYSVVAVILIMLSSLLILIDQNWRRMILALAVQYLGAFWLVALSWPFDLAVVKLVVGWVAGVVLGASQSDLLPEDQFRSISGRLFRVIAAVLVWIMVYVLVGPTGQWIPAESDVLWGGLLLVGIGLLQLGMSIQPLRVILGLLTVLSGFEVLFAAVETSVLLTGLLAVITLGIALAGAYLISPTQEQVK